MTTGIFHPAVEEWFRGNFPAPTAAQKEAWPAIATGKNVLIAAPTGSGKTLAAFLAAIDRLLRKGLDKALEEQSEVVYVSPLKALSNDIRRNLETPLAGIRAALLDLALPDVDIRVAVRTGDTTAGERRRMTQKPPHIIVTTPESLYILLGSRSGRRMLAPARTVILDEIHAVLSDKRGAHLSLSLERLEALCGRPLQRIGLSATQRPIAEAARFLLGAGGKGDGCQLVDLGERRSRDLEIEIPSSPLEAVMSAEVWSQVYDRLAELVAAHRTTLVFVNTRRLAERATRHLSERLGALNVATHHGSLSKEQRLAAEQRLKEGRLKALVATASLELGIDIGEVDLVCQLGATRSIASFLQRIGRSGHRVGGVAKGRLFPLSRDELVLSAALLDSVRRGELDSLSVRDCPLDVLAQQIAAEVAVEEWEEERLFALCRRAYPYRSLEKGAFAAILRMLREGFATRRGRRGALLYHDRVNHRLKGRRGAALLALTNGGTIPDTADYQVLLEPEGLVIGTVNEDFAVESLAGDVFQLGNAAYRILRIERGLLRVADAEGAEPNIPFWLGEAPARSDELSRSLSRLREEIASRLEEGEALAWLSEEVGVAPPAAREIVDYLAAGKAAFGLLPTQKTLVFERFFDASGGMQLVIHSPYGSRINRAWGLSLRKRFCRRFNFELQASAGDDHIVLSLTEAHSFELSEVARYLHSASVRILLREALLDAPMFMTRWRWVGAIALALPRFRGGRKVPPPLARMEAEDLLGAIFPDAVACAENLAGAREIPDHPLVCQTIADCLTEAMDAAGLESLLRGLETGAVTVFARDLREPSPLALAALAVPPYSFLDGAPLEERRTQAARGGRFFSAESAAGLGSLDREAIARVRAEAWPEARDADELCDALATIGFLTEAEASAPLWKEWLCELARQRRAARLEAPCGPLWIAAERLPEWRSLFAEAALEPPLAPLSEDSERALSREEGLDEILRARLGALGPVSAAALASSLGLAIAEIDCALARLESEGFCLRGRWTPEGPCEEWCERRLLARIHSSTLGRLRAEIEPVQARDFLRFLCHWQRVAPGERMQGADALEAVLGQLEGFAAAAAAWESEILPARLKGYEPSLLDDCCLSGRLQWARVKARSSTESAGAAPIRTSPIAFFPRRHAALWASFLPDGEGRPLRAKAKKLALFIEANGASFFDELKEASGLFPLDVEEGLAELVGQGLLTCDSFAGLRALLLRSRRRRRSGRRGPFAGYGVEDAGRWVSSRRRQPANGAGEAVEHMARALLRRYGIVFYSLTEREAPALPPWRELLRVYRRLEARGEIRGGRFLAGFPGEHFALPEAVGLLRALKKAPPESAYLSLSGADPLNLLGILFPGPRLPALEGNRVLYRDGLPVAVLRGGAVEFFSPLDAKSEWEAKKALLRSPFSPALADLT